MKDDGSIYDPISFRPPQDLAPGLHDLCEQLGYRKAQTLAACLEAVLEMIEADEPAVPRLVTMVRTLRQQRATLRDKPRPFAHGAASGQSGPGAEIVPFPTTASARVLVPIFGSIAAGHPVGSPATQPAEYFPVPAEFARGGSDGKFALRVAGDSMNRSKEGIQDGDIVLMVEPESRQPVHGDIVAALVDGETCLKRFFHDKPGKSYLQSESDNPAFGKIHPARELVIQGVFLSKL
jgi:SOS-response transcriptional repressor LexA